MSHTHTHTGGGWTDEAKSGENRSWPVYLTGPSALLCHTHAHTHTHTGGGWTEEAKRGWEVGGGGGGRTEIDLSIGLVPQLSYATPTHTYTGGRQTDEVKSEGHGN